jgi:hypothetical protein
VSAGPRGIGAALRWVVPLVLLVSGLVALAFASPAGAATGSVAVACSPFVLHDPVPNHEPAGCISLPDAIAQAELTSGADTILLFPGQFCPVDLEGVTGAITFEGMGLRAVDDPSLVQGPIAALSAFEVDPNYCSDPGYLVKVHEDTSTVSFRDLAFVGGVDTGLDGEFSNISLRDVIAENNAGTGVNCICDNFHMAGSTIENNGFGVIFQGSGELTNNTIYGNTDVGLDGFGNSAFVLANDTITGNNTGLAGNCCGTTDNVVNTVVTGNTHDCGANDLISQGHNVAGDLTCPFNDATDATNQRNANPPLILSAPSGNQGGPTPTISPPSALVNHGDNNRCPALDQREARRTDGLCDIGAVELAASVAPVATLLPATHDLGFVTVGTQQQTTISVQNDGGGTLDIDHVSLTGSADFSIPAGADGCSGVELLPATASFSDLFGEHGEHCDVTVDVQPTAPGAISGTLTLYEDHPSEEPGTATLSATGTNDVPTDNTGTPSISGATVDGVTLTGDPGTWTGTPTPILTSQWLRCTDGDCSPIDGATGTTYALTPDDVGSTIEFEVTGTNDVGTVTKDSDATPVVTEPCVAPTGGPENDNFADAASITGPAGSADGTTVGATKECGEPNHGGDSGGHSVWYQWTAATDGHESFHVSGNFFVVEGAYTGDSVTTLVEVAGDSEDAQSAQVSFGAVAGTTYRIAVDGEGGDSGTFTLTWNGPPANDNFSSATTIVGTNGSVDGTNVGATGERHEPNISSSPLASVWYSWTAPNTGTYVFDLCGANFDTTLGVYTGASVGSLTTVAENDDAPDGLCPLYQSLVTFDASAGTTYFMAVDGYQNGTGPFPLKWSEQSTSGTPPTVTLTSPSPDSTVTVATPVFTGSAGIDAGDASTVEVDVSAGSHVTNPPLEALSTDVDPATGDFTVPAPSLADGTYAVQATQQSAAGPGTSDVTFFTVDTQGPDITITTPADGATYTQDQVVDADYSCTDPNGITHCQGPVDLGTPLDTSTVGPHTFTVDASDAGGNASTATVDYTVVPVTFTLTTTSAGIGAGVVVSAPLGISCAPTCTGDFVSGSTVTLVATPNAGSTFTGWSGDCTGTDASSCSVTMDQARSVTATFDLLPAVVSDDESIGVTDDVTVTPVTFTLTTTSAGIGAGVVVSAPLGISCAPTCTGDFVSGSTVTLVATPNAGSTFTGWSGDCTGTDASSCSVTMDQARSVTATFGVAGQQLSVSLVGGGGGTVTSSPAGINCGAPGGACTASFPTGTVVGLTATPSAFGRLRSWGGACAGTASCQVTMTQNLAVTAAFDQRLDVIRSGSGPGGITSSPTGIRCGAGGSCRAFFAYGTTVNLTATADAGSAFLGWGAGDCTGVGTCTVTMNQHRTATAQFALTRTLSVSLVGGGGGTVTSSPTGINCGPPGGACTATFPAGTTVSLTATPSAFGELRVWGGACTGTTPCQFTLTKNLAITATFALRLDVTRSGTGSGEVTSTPAGIGCGAGGSCQAFFDYGKRVTLTATTNTGSTFTGWVAGDCTGSSTCTVTMTQYRSATAQFTLNAAPVVTTNPTSQTVTSGTGVTFTAAASGVPTPSIQWQYSANSGKTAWHDIGKATGNSLTGVAGTGVFVDGNRFRAVFTNSVGAAQTTAATLTVQRAALPVGLVALAIPPVMSAVQNRKRHRNEPRHARRKRSGTR